MNERVNGRKGHSVTQDDYREVHLCNNNTHFSHESGTFGIDDDYNRIVTRVVKQYILCFVTGQTTGLNCHLALSGLINNVKLSWVVDIKRCSHIVARCHLESDLTEAI